MLNNLYGEYRTKDNIILLSADLIASLSAMEISLVLAGRETSEIEDKVEDAFALHYFLGQWRLKINYK